MPNTKSAKKAIRSSQRKQMYNLFWKGRIKKASKSLKRSIDDKVKDADLLEKQLTVLQKVLDKASKKQIISKNKANRLKSKYAKKAAAQIEKGARPKSEKKK